MTNAKGFVLFGWSTVLTATLIFSGCGGSVDKDLRSGNSSNPNLTPKHVDNDADAEGKKKPVTPVKEDEEVGGDETAGKTPEVPLAKIEASIGLRNYEQINATMSVITGIPPSTPAVNTAFAILTTSLPTDNDIKGFGGSIQVSVFKLAVEYCDALVKNTTKRAEFFPGFNFAGTPAAVLNASGKAVIADTLVSKIWGKGLDFLPAHSESVASVMSLIDDVMIGKNAAQVAVTGAVVTGVCTAVLASAPAMMY